MCYNQMKETQFLVRNWKEVSSQNPKMIQLNPLKLYKRNLRLVYLIINQKMKTNQ